LDINYFIFFEESLKAPVLEGKAQNIWKIEKLK
jgi:hypothetical protein